MPADQETLQPLNKDTVVAPGMVNEPIDWNPMGHRSRRQAPLLALGLSLLALSALSQGEAFLLDLHGNRVSIRYSPGSLDRAARLQYRMEEIAESVSRWGKTPVSLVIYLLPRQEWNGAGLVLPYGVPERLSTLGLALPAWGDGGTVELWQRLAGTLPSTEAEPLRGTASEATSLELGDHLGEVEAARMLLEKADLLGGAAWISDLMAHSVVRSTRGGDPQLARADGFFRELLESYPGRPPPLTDYRTGLSLSQWLWFHARFRQGAAVLAAESGDDAAKRLLKLARKDGGRIGEERLLERFPELIEWRRRSFGQCPAGIEDGTAVHSALALAIQEGSESAGEGRGTRRLRTLRTGTGKNGGLR